MFRHSIIIIIIIMSLQLAYMIELFMKDVS